MSRSFSATVRAMANAAAQAERARQRARNQMEAAEKRASQNRDRQAAADAKDAARVYLAMRLEEVEALTKDIREREAAIDTVLSRSLDTNPSINLNDRVKAFVPETFNEHHWVIDQPLKFLPQPPGFFARLIPGSDGRYRQKVKDAEQRYQEAITNFELQRQERDLAVAKFQQAEEDRKSRTEAENNEIRNLQAGISEGERTSVVSYLQGVIDGTLNGEPDALSAELGYSFESKHLVVDLELPDLLTIPSEIGFRYVKSTDRIDPILRSVSKRNAAYSHLICQIVLKCVDTVFRSGVPADVLQCLTVNGMLDTVDPATGRETHVCLLSVRITDDTFRSLNLRQVQPEHCLRSLKASVSRAPAEMVPVKPIVELNMVDPRFVQTIDVVSNLEHRQNLMELSPTEFEGLITNLFAKMGLETRQTQASRDGGVDCVAFDSRPIFGGKVVIQAKRYKNTVGVNAVRDLFGTVQNEGASKGILVTTSGYGKASFEFAKGKPLELLDGSALLYLLAEHAGMEARIVMPESWVDRPFQGE